MAGCYLRPWGSQIPEDSTIPLYLSRFSYTPETWARLVNNPEDRRIAIGGGGALSSFETTVLLTVEETLEALHQAQGVQYRAPGA